MDQGTQPTLTVNSYDIAGITFVKMQGSLASTTAARGNEELRKILDKGAQKVVVNLAELDYMSSAGLRVLLTTSKLLKNVRGELKISAANEAVKEALETCGFNDQIKLCDSDEEAMTAFNG